jgi:serine/threonine-protein kinase
MLLRTGEVKLLDFGVAKADRTLKQGATVVGKVKGKLSYMSPEQHAGKLVDLRADVFSLGVMLWEMLAGQPLFSGDRGTERSRKMMRGEVPAPSTLRVKVTPALDAIVLRCLKVQPDDRYPSAGSLADALGDFVRPSLFDPTELAALVTDYPAHDGREPASESDASPAAESHAVLTREDSQGEQTDDVLMAATTARERLHPALLPAPAAAPETAPATPESPPSPAAVPPPAPALRRFWPVLVVVAVAVGLALAMVPRRAPGPPVTVTAPRRGAEIQPVPAPAAESALPETPAIAPEPRPEVPPARPRAPATGRSRPHPVQPQLKLVDPF